MAGDPFFNTIEKIYGAALAPEAWPDALSQLARLLGATRARLWIEQDGGVRHWDNHGESPPLASIADVLHELSSAPQPHAESSVLVSRSQTANAVLAVYRSRKKFRASDGALLEKLRKHVELALQIGHRLSQASALENENACILEHLGARFQVSESRGGGERFAFAEPSTLSMAQDKKNLRTDLLHELYGLTEAEANLCNALLQQSGLATAASRLGVSVNTAKTQLQAVFQKMGVSRQSELLQLLLRGPAQLFSWAAAANDQEKS